MMAAKRMKSTLVRRFATLTLALAAAAAARAQSGVTETEVRCDGQGQRCREVAAAFSFPDGVHGELLLSFQDATLLGDDTFEISAREVDPRDPDVVSRLPRDTFVPADFPVIVKIEPRHGGRLSFRRNWTLELVAENLDFSSHTPFRLFRAPEGGAFQDISFSLGSGSFRVRGAGGRFSEYLIAADLRPAERVITDKLARLRLTLDAVAQEIGSAARNALNRRVDQTQQALAAGDLPGALARLDQFLDLVESGSGSSIPDDTRPDDDVEGAAARLLSAALTLRHAIFLSLQSAQGGMSGFSRRLSVGGYEARLDLTFDEAYVVRAEDLEIEGEVMDVNDPDLLARLPEGVRVPEEFPVLIRVEPRSGKNQAFRGVFEIEVRTDSLDFQGGTPLRLFKASDGGAFADITDTYGLGSFRVRGAGGRFSEFLIAEDLRPVAAVIGSKLAAVGAAIDAAAGEISAEARAQLESALSGISQNVEQGSFRQAIAGAEAVIAAIGEASGESIPALWRSDDPLANVAGELTSLLMSLVFSLEIRDQPTAAAPGDVNLDGQVDVGDVFFLINQVFGNAPPGSLSIPPSSDDKR